MATISPPAPRAAKCILTPINLHNEGEFDLLHKHRIICAWDLEPEVLRNWRDRMDAKTRAMFWITPPALESASGLARFVGHIGIESSVEPEDLELANPDKSVMTLSTFFIMPEHRGGGLGRAAVELAETYARIEPYGRRDCQAVTIHTISRRYVEEDGDEWRGMYARRGLEAPPKGKGTEDWYARMGYVKWKEAPKYHDVLKDGTEIMLIAVFMRKELG